MPEPVYVTGVIWTQMQNVGKQINLVITFNGISGRENTAWLRLETMSLKVFVGLRRAGSSGQTMETAWGKTSKPAGK